MREIDVAAGEDYAELWFAAVRTEREDLGLPRRRD